MSNRRTEGNQSIQVDQLNSHAAAAGKLIQCSGSRGATGPRTRTGKQRSKYNATTHGIFSRATLLANESKSDLDSLLRGLIKDLKPEGMLEGFLVEKLATLFWRYKRCLAAEAAQVQTNITFPGADKRYQPGTPVVFRVVMEQPDDGELIRHITSPHVLEECLRLLNDLKSGLERSGFDENRDSQILVRIFGRHIAGQRNQVPDELRELDGNYASEDLYEKYRIWTTKANYSDDERQRNQSPEPEQCRKSFLADVENEIRRLERYKSIEREKIRLQELRRTVADPSRPDYLLRYEAQLERSIERTLNLLERRQRMRLGQPVPAPISLDVSSS